MSVSVADFVGSWNIGFIDNQHGEVVKDSILLIGTGSGWGDRPPKLTDEYEICVGFALLAPSEDGGYYALELSTVENRLEKRPQPLWLLLSGTQLRWEGYYDRQPLYIYVSVAETKTQGGARSIHLYGCTIAGDPDQVGVWGASSTPPPPPPPPAPAP
jgi:hypothetical protein